MRLLTCVKQGIETGAVLNSKGEVVLFTDLFGEPLSILEFIRSGALLPEYDHFPSHPLQELHLRAPIPRPARDVICLGKNYLDHAKEMTGTAIFNDKQPEHPIYFTKSAYSVIGSDEPILPHTSITNQLDYEVELAVIIGCECRDITEEEAERVIFGYTIINDITARDIQTRHVQWTRGKSLDTSCPMGPVIVTADEFDFPPALNICSRVNGEIRQNSNTANMIFSIPYIISELSQGMTLKPGDIISTGTPAGVGHAMKPPRHLISGDEVECEIENIGILRNVIAD